MTMQMILGITIPMTLQITLQITIQMTQLSENREQLDQILAQARRQATTEFKMKVGKKKSCWKSSSK